MCRLQLQVLSPARIVAELNFVSTIEKLHCRDVHSMRLKACTETSITLREQQTLVG
jgi:hypothetical protein